MLVKWLSLFVSIWLHAYVEKSAQPSIMLQKAILRICVVFFFSSFFPFVHKFIGHMFSLVQFYNLALAPVQASGWVCECDVCILIFLSCCFIITSFFLFSRWCKHTRPCNHFGLFMLMVFTLLLAWCETKSTCMQTFTRCQRSNEEKRTPAIVSTAKRKQMKKIKKKKQFWIKSTSNSTWIYCMWPAHTRRITILLMLTNCYCIFFYVHKMFPVRELLNAFNAWNVFIFRWLFF